MKTYDLSHTIHQEMPVFPGDMLPTFYVRATVPEDGFYERSITLSSHTGTHMDAPAHIIQHAPTLDRMPIDNFIGKAAVIDLTGVTTPEIAVDHLKPYESLFKESEFILFRTGWSRYWGQERYFRDFPVFSIEAALWVDSFMLKGIGVDAISVDAMNSTDLPIHKILLERSLIIENLTNLEQLPQKGFIFTCFPLKLDQADASPIRAVAIV